jgi:hypothetical protein
MITDEEMVALLNDAACDVDVPPAPAEALARSGLARRRRRRVLGVAVAAVAAAVGVGAPLTVAALRPGREPVASAAGCVARVPAAVLPHWARAGFSGGSPRIPYVLSTNGDMVAVLFAQPLTSPAAADHNNKILWVARPGQGSGDQAGSGSSLRIEASLSDGTSVTRTVPGGPGPSIIDLPKPGCWHLTLRWSGRTDDLDLGYAPR